MWLKLLIQFLVLNQVAFAYLPPSGFVLKQWFNKKAGLKNVKLKSELKLGAIDSENRLKVTTWLDYSSAELLVRITDASGVEVGTYDRKWTLPDQAFPPAAQLLFSNQLDSSIQELKRLGFAVVSEGELLMLGTEDERIKSEQVNQKMGRMKATAWVYAKADRDKKGPELWFEKDTYYPMRVLYSPSGNDVSSAQDLIDIKLENYRYFKDFSYPRTVHVENVFREELTDISINVDGKTFDREMKAVNRKEMDSAIKSVVEPYIRVLR